MARLNVDRDVIPELFVGDGPEMVANRFSGMEIELTAEEVAVYDWIMGSEMFGMYDNVRAGIDWFIKNNPEAYMVLLD
jgi:hypothetical protein